MKLSGQFSISRTQSSSAPDAISIRVGDAKSSITFLVVSIPLAEFAQCITGLVIDCELEVQGLERIGKKREHKTRSVFIPKGKGPHTTREERAREAIKPLEVDGWHGRLQDAMNSHRIVEYTAGGSVYSVDFERWVEKEDST